MAGSPATCYRSASALAICATLLFVTFGVIDALSALVDTLGTRLGEGEQMLRDALGQAQMLFVEVAESRGA